MKEPDVPRLFGLRLQQARRERGLSQAALAEKIGVSTRLIRYYESAAKTPQLERLRDISIATGRPIAWFLTDRGSGEVAVYDAVPAGAGRDAVAVPIGTVTVPARFTDKGEVYCLHANGDSMTPFILDGDLLIVRRQNHGDSGQIVVASTRGVSDVDEFTVKRLTRKGRSLVLRADNPAYSVPTGPFRIDGIVIGLVRDVVRGRVPWRARDE